MLRTLLFPAWVVLLVSACAGARQSAPVDLAAAPSAVPADLAPITPDLIVDANELIARQPTPPICRDVLRQNSNVIVTRCMSAADWKTYERREAREAEAVVRMLQGGHYR